MYTQGFVGINTSSPKSELAVNGKVTALEFVVGSGGVAVGEMMEKLSRKIEELTLDLAAQSQRIEALEKRNAGGPR